MVWGKLIKLAQILRHPRSKFTVFFRNAPRVAWYRVTKRVLWKSDYVDPLIYWANQAGDLKQREAAPRNTARAELRLACRKEVLAELGNSQFKTLLEAGCGYGRELIPIQDNFPTATCYGFDISHEMLKQAATDCSALRLCQGTIGQLPFQDNSFDVTLTATVMYDAHPVVIDQMIDELIRVTRYRIYHQEPYTKHFPTREMKQRFAFSRAFSHDYDNIYSSRGHRILRSSVLDAYAYDLQAPEWHSLIAIELNKLSELTTN